jgi:hypothetical protein
MWLLLEGLDRTGKSSVAEVYKAEGFEVIHLGAPNKKYFEPGYTGPSYVDELLDLLMKYDGKDVVFDRTWYGEFIWPYIYNRKPCVEEDDLELFEEYENKNSAQKIYMMDPNKDAHWQRIVDDKESLTRSQFVDANNRYGKIAHKFNFIPKTLGDFNEKLARNKSKDSNTVQQKESIENRENETSNVDNATLHKSEVKSISKKESNNPLQEKLEKANAINSILSKRIIKQKGDIFDSIEKDIKNFLDNKLSEIMGTEDKFKTNRFSDNEVQMLKTFCKQWENKIQRGNND